MGEGCGSNRSLKPISDPLRYVIFVRLLVVTRACSVIKKYCVCYQCVSWFPAVHLSSTPSFFTSFSSPRFSLAGSFVSITLSHPRPRHRSRHLCPTSSLLPFLHSRKTEQPVDRIFLVFSFQLDIKSDGGNRKGNPFGQDLNIEIFLSWIIVNAYG